MESVGFHKHAATISREVNQYDQYKASLYDAYFTGVNGDVDFYLQEALRMEGAVLEVGCGTGRISLLLASAGVKITALDSSAEMLDVMRRQLAEVDDAVRSRIAVVQDDIRTVRLSERYRQAIIPYRTFMHLLTPQDQVQALRNIHRHLLPKGRLIFNIFDPSAIMLEHIGNTGSLQFDTEFTHPVTHNRVLAWHSRQIDIIAQIIYQQFVFEEYGNGDELISRNTSPLTLRYSHRYEMHYLLELCGFEVDALYGDFAGAPFNGSEQVWIAHRR